MTLPVYPLPKGFSASQLAQFHSNLANALAQLITLPLTKLDTPSTRIFVSSYVSDAAQQTLAALIWEDPPEQDSRLHQRVLLLAEKLVPSTPGLELKTLLDLCLVFSSKITRLRSLLYATLSGTPDLPTMFALEVVPAFTSQLSPSRSSGLYGLRKTARCLTSLLRPSPPDLVRSFAHSKEFMVALAQAYDDGLVAISRSYGGIRIGVVDRELDQWEKLWLDTKVDIVDAFHLIVKMMVQDISFALGTRLTAEADRAFGVVFALLDITPHSRSTTVGPAEDVPFLNRTLVADYQYAYKLNKTLASALRNVSRDDGRMELLESTLRSFDLESSGGNTKDPGALKLILRSPGFVPGVTCKPTSTNKDKRKAVVSERIPPPDLDLDLRMTQVLDIFPDQSPDYIRKLLTLPSSLCGSAEKVIEALLEGTAPDENALKCPEAGVSIKVPEVEVVRERRNAFDQDVMDLSRVHVGKKRQETSLIRDRTEIERMKTEILRRVEEMSEDSDEEVKRPKALDVTDLDDDLDEVGPSVVKVLGDGEDSSDEEVDGERGVDPIKPETMLERAYIRDPKLFDRDAETRRSKSRADLKQQTGWTDEQIEGWRIMLERNPKKERILQKHEFSGNKTIDIPIEGPTEVRPGGRQRDGGRGRGRGRGRGQGINRGGKSGPGGKKDEVARERAFKEKHKSGNRKRGHDKKMARGGAGSTV